MDIFDYKHLILKKEFLGKEFLSWLIFKIDMNMHKFQSKHFKNPINFHVSDKVVLYGTQGDTHTVTLQGGQPAYAKELKLSLKENKQVQKANFIISEAEDEYSFLLTHNLLSPQNLKIPNSSGDHPADRINDRMEYVNRICDFLDDLYAEFLDLRLNDVEKITKPYEAWLNE